MGVKAKPDFSGYVTKAGLKCSDGRTILSGAFQHQDKETVPLVWQHGHDDSGNVLGHCVLENRDDGVYGYGYFNKTDQGKNAKELVEHKDIKFLSIFANKLVEKAQQVSHGIIREVSLVLAGANPGAVIDNIALQHSDGGTEVLEEEAIITTGLELQHASSDDDEDDEDEGEPTVQDVYEGMTPDQQNVVHYMIGAALDNEGVTHSDTDTGSTNSDGKEGNVGTKRTTSRNLFEGNGAQKEGEKTEGQLSHSALKEIVENAKNVGSLKASFEEYGLQHGIEDIDILFPDAKAILDRPEWDSRRIEWVQGVLTGTKHTPFSRIKSLTADITHKAARAKGYIKGTLKKEEFFGLVKRVTTPATVYKKQKLDRDDIVDITDFDVVMWLKGEMRLMLDEEIARAVLIGDGREVDDEDKIKDPMGSTEGAGIRSILHDDDLYAAKVNINFGATPIQIVDAILTQMKLYKGSGSPTFYTTLPVLTKLLLARDGDERRYYRTASDLAQELTVKNIVTVESMEDEENLIGIIVNLVDYTIGADKGGSVAMFDDFDIDYNQYKYLIETRCSGALIKIRSALVLMRAEEGDDEAIPVAPDFDPETNEVTVATTTGVIYKDASDNTTLTTGAPVELAEGESLKVYAVADDGYYLPNNVEDEWTFTYEA